MDIAKGGAQLDSQSVNVEQWDRLWDSLRGQEEWKTDIGSRYALNKKCMGVSQSGKARRDSVQVKLE
jgi:hypothetical protein